MDDLPDIRAINPHPKSNAMTTRIDEDGDVNCSKILTLTVGCVQ